MSKRRPAPPPPETLDPQGLLMLLRCEPGTVETLVERTRAPVSVVSAALAELCRDGLATEEGGVWLAPDSRPLRDRILAVLRRGACDVDEMTRTLARESRDEVWEALNRLWLVEGLATRRVEDPSGRRRVIYELVNAPMTSDGAAEAPRGGSR